MGHTGSWCTTPQSPRLDMHFHARLHKYLHAMESASVRLTGQAAWRNMALGQTYPERLGQSRTQTFQTVAHAHVPSTSSRSSTQAMPSRRSQGATTELPSTVSFNRPPTNGLSLDWEFTTSRPRTITLSSFHWCRRALCSRNSSFEENS